MTRRQILVTNDDGWDAPGLAALLAVAEELGEVYVVAPRDPHSEIGHRVTVNAPLELTQTGERAYHLAGTPADCVRVALTSLLPRVDFVLSGINRGGNLGADIYSSGTVAAAREAALLGTPAAAVSQYVRRGAPLDWGLASALAAPVVARVLAAEWSPKDYWNINLPHLEAGATAPVADCEPDDEPLDVRFQREGDVFVYAGAYVSRPRKAGRDVAHCFGGSVTVSRLRV